MKKDALVVMLGIVQIAGIAFLWWTVIQTLFIPTFEVGLAARLFVIIRCPAALVELHLARERKTFWMKMNAALATVVAVLFISYSNPIMLLW